MSQCRLLTARRSTLNEAHKRISSRRMHDVKIVIAGITIWRSGENALKAEFRGSPAAQHQKGQRSLQRGMITSVV